MVLAWCAECTPPAAGAVRIGGQDVAGRVLASGGDGPWFQAQHGGRCTGCGEAVEPGGMIRWSAAESAYVCSGCGAE
jgi:hypothetical protein